MRISINGSTVEVPDGASISVRDNTLYVNGSRWDGPDNGAFRGSVLVRVEGVLSRLQTDGSAEVRGEVRGDVTCGNNCVVHGPVTGSVDAGNNAVCGRVAGRASAGNTLVTRG